METIGYLAGTITTLSLFPQIVRTLRSKSSGDLSSGWLTAMIVGMLLWVTYGYSIKNYPMVFFNSIGFMSFAFLLGTKLLFDRRGNQNKAQ